MKSFRADYVFPVCADPVKNGIVTVDDFGKIVAISDQPSDHHNPNAEHLHGIICPGFVNTHCHLELSHMQGKVERGTGLVNFIKNLQALRNSEPREIEAAAAAADAAMYQQGIVAVGDISNSTITAPIKAQSKLYYHTFVEVFSFTPARADAAFQSALEIVEYFRPLPASITPHAPYSVSKELFRMIKNYTDQHPNLISMHNQECDDENKFFRYKLGEFVSLYEHFGINIDFFKPQARNSIQSVLPLLSNKQPVLLVHNTCTNLKDIYFIKRFDRKINWCFCPNANLYIEGKLPKVDLFADQGFNITLGTDSLASNHTLSILDEMLVLQSNFPKLDLSRLLEWGTLNGAQFLGIDNKYGSIQAGKTPGLNLITGLDGLRLTGNSQVKRLV
ncbi:cytosine/adenosine deaminase-related metal-dependent hydrolase [Mucilaginibacter yixingensis]|uniref:Cytosine/adenosine deaminase-related metal-dependent hydrolase n=1 Tax=Mucilaginibacter yixingensis TaxID=1295612 RepID=A0A2T5J8U9_9SPHI|nr:amidohydrolase family protein [Mucilaginibacter yixingensis]PTQ95824.1 cytosine/adenosine deaminase-related metal-dependent hydrolase [Mucilaginibacter yixingensis]